MTVSERSLAFRPLWRSLAPTDAEVGLPTTIAGIDLRNPVGLAAGLDKRCAYLASLGDWGFGYVVGGTVTARGRAGNAKPRVLRLVESERITVVSAAPAMLLQLLESEDFDRRDTSSLFSVGAGGAATPPRTSRLIYEKLPESYSGTGWGMTETNAIGTSFTGNPHKHKPGSAGFQHPTVEIEVRAPEGGVLPQGEPGELWIKSATLISEYWNRPDATAKDFRDGWFNSGDIGYFDEESYLFISDRAKDMVIRGGENIYPAEIEGVLHDCPEIEEAAAFGIADEQWGEQLAVVVVARAGAQLSAEDVREFAARKLARFKVPHYVFLHGQPLPRSASGKVLKKDLKAEYEKLAGQDFARDQDQA